MTAISGAAFPKALATNCLKGGSCGIVSRRGAGYGLSLCHCDGGNHKIGLYVAVYQPIYDHIKPKGLLIHQNGSSGARKHRLGLLIQSSRQSEDDDTKASAIRGVKLQEKRNQYLDENKNHRHNLNDSINDFSSSKKDVLPVLVDENFGAVVAEAAEKVVETVEVAVQTVSAVGEIETSFPTEPALDRVTAIKTVAFWVTAALGFGTLIGINEGFGKASEFFAGYLLEQSLSVDNLFVFVVIFNYFRVPLSYQSRVLTYGISGAIVFRASMILLGVVTLQNFEAVNLIFASVLLFSSYKLFTEREEEEVDLSGNYVMNICKKFIPVTSEYDGNKFFTNVDGIRKATPLLLTLAVVELSDIAFAVDSIPAVFGVTRDPFIVFSSNMFAILGLRSLYTLISSSMYELKYLQPAIGAVLGFIGSKMVLDFFGYHISTEVSLGTVATILTAGTILSLLPSSQKQ
ncbi:hypothetical protein O6H91_21G040800 [Diphasiastrum complanatum]|uniref:Uncharacterized protein n=2 Tax=Diphasiastrum complanatum TaxID=34168 RepID=A0ACC2AJV3_DIPCM|nr:hypothetical protein O6H91_21G040800 [Diphasiastrum complanatum]KAJ7517811.1 hypothetical protein O6H91_21G040800 [Diphasiastrum complanatum]